MAFNLSEIYVEAVERELGANLPLEAVQNL
jgi:hypothetical protein